MVDAKAVSKAAQWAVCLVEKMVANLASLMAAAKVNLKVVHSAACSVNSTVVHSVVL